MRENLLVGSCAINNRRHGCARRLGAQVLRHMKSGGAQDQIGKIWREYFYDRKCAPPEWRPHPHCRFKPVGRFVSTLMGSMVAVGAILVGTGVTTRLDEESIRIGWTFWVILVTGGLLWFIAVLTIAATEQKRMLHYVVAGIRPPAAVVLVIQLIQSYT